jgi:isoleucyl-tRNA synthetase
LLLKFLQAHAAQLPTIFIVSHVETAPFDRRPEELEPLAPELAVRVARAEGAKCARCWTYRTDVGRSDRHPTLCGRCVAVLDHA